MSDGASLELWGLRAGEPVRFRRVDLRRWQKGHVSGVGRDGSLLLHDADGAARSVRPDNVEVRRPGSRGRLVWRRVSDLRHDVEQLRFFD
jgi:hypothetical protein